jgi:Rrf2 family iron-responsive transcriptional regulator
MKLNHTTQYAFRLLIVLSSNPQKLFVIKDIAKHLHLSYKYLAAIVTQLVKANLIESIRGRDGGIKLARDADEIRLIDILDATEEPYSENECILGIGTCGGASPCAFHGSWEKAQAAIRDTFGNRTLADLEIHADTAL